MSDLMLRIDVSSQPREFCYNDMFVVFFLLGVDPASEFYVPTFQNTLSHLHRWCLPMKMEQTECSKTLIHEIQTPGNHPKGRIQHSELTYLLTPWSRILLEKLTGSATSQEIPRIFGTRRFLTVPTSAHHLSLS